MRRFIGLTTLVLVATVFGGTRNIDACTGVTLKAKDGSIIFARTLEFGADLHSNVIVIPRGKQYVGTTATKAPGKTWTTKFGCVGANGLDLPIIVSGVNEKGLSIGLFYFPGYAKYQTVAPAEASNSMSPLEIGTYLLTTTSNVKEAATAAHGVRVGAVIQPQMGIVPPVHYVVTDATGASIVIEYLDGQLKIFDNPLGVVTNAPSYDWHMTNLSNYVNLLDNDVDDIRLGGYEIKALGQGSGMLGLPGDFTPPSRFVRAVAFSKSAYPTETARDAVLQAFHILNQFDIPYGSTRSSNKPDAIGEYTEWTAAVDLQNLQFYFRTYENSAIRMVDLKSFDLDAMEIKTISMGGNEVIEDLSKTAK